ncbi:MAG: glycoside hydrolase family 99-like domain-containing protein [Bacteroidales bacterium]|nr:glycoside hydrolase family 99-like domain-containing protein [Bacteroidales bacterium]
MKIYAYFLPQFYPTPENDKFWGKGFTDWDSTRNAKPLFPFHDQPIAPGDADYYDLRDAENLKRLCLQASQYGIDGFGYWHYWFGNGFQTLEKIQEAHLRDKGIAHEYFFAWANQDWTKSWQGDDKTIIFKQTYSRESAANHYKYLKEFICDKRYVKYKGKPLFQVISPQAVGALPYIYELENLLKRDGQSGFHWVFPREKIINLPIKDLEYSLVGYPPGTEMRHGFGMGTRIQSKLKRERILKTPMIIPQKSYLKAFRKEIEISEHPELDYFPCLLSGWDNTPRYKKNGFLITGEKSDLLENQFNIIRELYKDRKLPEILFIKAWNEWAEGNILEPYLYRGKLDFPASRIPFFRAGFNETDSEK